MGGGVGGVGGSGKRLNFTLLRIGKKITLFLPIGDGAGEFCIIISFCFLQKFKTEKEKTMLKKITPFILKIIPAVSLLFGAFVASNASAWDEVCVKFNDGLIEEGRFYVVYGFRVEDDGRFPTSYYDEDGERRLLPAWLHPEGYARPTDDSQPVALGRIRSSYGGAGSTRCVAINKLRPREPFFVYVEYLASLAGGRETFWHGRCGTHRSNPELWYYQQHRPYRKMQYESTTTTEAECTYWRETN